MAANSSFTVGSGSRTKQDGMEGRGDYGGRRNNKKKRQRRTPPSSKRSNKVREVVGGRAKQETESPGEPADGRPDAMFSLHPPPPRSAKENEYRSSLPSKAWRGDGGFCALQPMWVLLLGSARGPPL